MLSLAAFTGLPGRLALSQEWQGQRRNYCGTTGHVFDHAQQSHALPQHLRCQKSLKPSVHFVFLAFGGADILALIQLVC